MTGFDKILGLATLPSLALSLLFAAAPSAHAAPNVFDGKNFAMDYGVSSGRAGSFRFPMPTDRRRASGVGQLGRLNEPGRAFWFGIVLNAEM